jgi:hypothetical protein
MSIGLNFRTFVLSIFKLYAKYNIPLFLISNIITICFGIYNISKGSQCIGEKSRSLLYTGYSQLCHSILFMIIFSILIYNQLYSNYFKVFNIIYYLTKIPLVFISTHFNKDIDNTGYYTAIAAGIYYILALLILIFSNYNLQYKSLTNIENSILLNNSISL